jgi:DNA-binding transcriptional ArsR family regulator
MPAKTEEKASAKKSATGKNDLVLDYSMLRKAVLTLRAVNHPLRKQIIKLLEENKKMTVTEIYVKLRLEQSVASQHLAIMRRSGIVVTGRDGKFIHYELNADRLREIATLVNDLAA